MRPVILCTVLASLAAVLADSLPPRNYNTHDYYAVHLDPSIAPAEFANHVGLLYEGALGSIKDHHLFKCGKNDGDIVEDAIQELKRRRRKREIGLDRHILDGIRFNQKQKLKPRMVKRTAPRLVPREGLPAEDTSAVAQRKIAETLNIQDPIFNEQWHLFNTHTPGNDLNVTGVWMQGITGKNSTVCIVDDGLDMDSDDLRDNYFAEGSYDYNDHGPEPKPRLSDDRHGTRCAGEVAAGKNNACGVGVAYDSRVSGVRILSGEISDADEALAVNYKMQLNDIYSCSWGPPDDGKTMQGPGILIERAMVTAVQQGRGGKGSIYVFAAGNGAANDDNCNFDGYTNSIYSVTVGAIDQKNNHPYYSEQCSAQLVVTYSSGSGEAIHTTDVGANKCTAQHGGTSAAGPLGAGIYALLLEARPDLSWRDVQWLTVMTAVKFEATSDWQVTALGREFSHQFGYGKLDAGALIDKAKDWKTVKPQAWYYSPWMHVKHEIPQGDQGLASTFVVTEEALKKANLDKVEHITLTMNVEHTRRGDLSVELRSPSGIVSHLATARKNDEASSGYVDWTFMSVAHWGESGIGEWIVIVKDTVQNEHSGNFTDWRLRLWGECDNADIQELRPIPGEHDDDDHDEVNTVTPHTTTIVVPTPTGDPAPGNPTDHPERPVNQRPSTTAGPSSTEPTAKPEETPKPTQDNFLPSPFPTFGVSKRTQIWIYGAVALILMFCCSLAAYFFIARRQRLLNSARENYEFEILEDQADGATTGLRSGRRKQRAGELYDAFAGGSDEDLFSDDDEDDNYRDEKGYDEDAEEYTEKSRLQHGVDSGSEGSGSGPAR
ncbi:KEX1 protease precursor [Pseudovirgaria hyperparasitica]|uniref:KEX1 protease n=1 Tax=Pseudovirgaria hyperparasitica TaxID=470096 RepID=A0A6A6VXS3_9PEZI|nr:KEX1 protease precursor [Pseudovirgaria hyperparasitica]KAF2754067.1 KEX1 protease precursor [Pseudovirgaria hyperparasitica]